VLLTLVGRRIKFGEVSCTECRGQGNDFELNYNDKNGNEKSRYRFGSEFPAISNHCGIMAA